MNTPLSSLESAMLNRPKMPNSAEIAAAMADYVPPRTIDCDELADRLAELDIYKPGLSYAETAALIMEV